MMEIVKECRGRHDRELKEHYTYLHHERQGEMLREGKQRLKTEGNAQGTHRKEEDKRECKVFTADSTRQQEKDVIYLLLIEV